MEYIIFDWEGILTEVMLSNHYQLTIVNLNSLMKIKNVRIMIDPEKIRSVPNFLADLKAKGLNIQEDQLVLVKENNKAQTIQQYMADNQLNLNQLQFIQDPNIKSNNLPGLPIKKFPVECTDIYFETRHKHLIEFFQHLINPSVNSHRTQPINVNAGSAAMKCVVFSWSHLLAKENNFELAKDAVVLLKKLNSKGVTVYVLTAKNGEDPTQNIIDVCRAKNILLSPKSVIWVGKNKYQGAEQAAQDKVKAILKLKQEKGLVIDDILFVESTLDTVNLAKKAGIRSIHIAKSNKPGSEERKALFQLVRLVSLGMSSENHNLKTHVAVGWGIGILVGLVIVALLSLACLPLGITIAPTVMMGCALAITAFCSALGAGIGLLRFQAKQDDEVKLPSANAETAITGSTKKLHKDLDVDPARKPTTNPSSAPINITEETEESLLPPSGLEVSSELARRGLTKSF